MMTAKQVIEFMKLEPLSGEGGFFRRTYCSEQTAEYRNAVKPIVSAIYYLITPDDFSALHLLQRDEIFHFYAGDSIDFIKIKNGVPETIHFGNNFENGEIPQIVVEGGVWQALRISENSETKNGWALVGTTVSPAFEFTDFTIGKRHELIAAYPHLKQFIMRFTRESEIS